MLVLAGLLVRHMEFDFICCGLVGPGPEIDVWYFGQG